MDTMLLFAETPDHVENFVEFYSKNLRTPLFAGFLTTASFMLSATTFMILNLKKEITDSELYRGTIRSAQSFGGKHKIRHTGPLRRILNSLLGAVSAALLTSFLQMTVGLLEYRGAAVICLIVAIVAFAAICLSLMLIWTSLATMIDFWERDGDARQKAAETEAILKKSG